MNNTTNHIIHKQIIDIRFADFTTANSWDAAKQARTAEAVRKCLEQCFEGYDATKEYLTIDRLVFDLGVFSSDQLLSKMPETLHRELHKILSSYSMTPNDFEERETTAAVSSINHWSAQDEDKQTAGPIVKNSEVTAFLFFLQRGYLPWWYSNKPAWEPEWLQQLTGENWQELRHGLMVRQEDEGYDEPALPRLISQFSDVFLTNLLKGLQGKEPVEKAWSWLTRVYETLQHSAINAARNESVLPSYAVLRRNFWKNWIGYAVGRSSFPELRTMFAIPDQLSLIAHFLPLITKNKEWLDSAPECWQGELISLIQKEDKREPGPGDSNEIVNYAKSKALREPKKVSLTDKGDFIIIPDSGLVLLHPFLPQFFEYCNWVNDNNFLNDEARNRAVNTLHYLAAGDEEVPEYVLMLPKLLCGIPPEWPMDPAQPLTGTERAACDELLVQVIGHWSALRNTSIAALRETFLCRQGKLYVTDKGSRLEVQRKTADILLDRLPWGFSKIKYAWMPRLLSVTWE